MADHQIRLLAVFQNNGRLCLTPYPARSADDVRIISEFEMLGARIYLAADHISSNQITEPQMSLLFAAVQAEVARHTPANKRRLVRATGEAPKCPDDRY